jgi:hypothetical protein
LFEKIRPKKDFLEELLLSVDVVENTFLIHYFSQGRISQIMSVSKDLFGLIKTIFGVNFLKKLLLTKNKHHENFLHALLSETFGGVEKSLEVLKILLQVVGKDKKFFRELTKQSRIPKEIKEFLKTNL